MLEQLLSILSDGRFHSGNDIAEAGGVTRAAVWKAVGRLEGLGVPVHRVRGRGYLVPGGMDLLDADAIYRGLSAEATERFGRPHVHLEVDSTNRLATDLAASDCGPVLVLAERQTRGRGRRGRNWVSPLGRNLYLSIVQRYSEGAGALAGLSLAVGIAVARTLRDVGVGGVSVKWPNDVLCNGRKLCGILIEVTGDMAGECAAVIGVGLNLSMSPEAGSEIDQPWTDVEREGCPYHSRNQWCVFLLNQLANVLDEFSNSGFAGFVREWNGLDHFRGQEVQLVAGQRVFSGVCRGVNSKGGLVIQQIDGEQVVYGGEVSLRGQP